MALPVTAAIAVSTVAYSACAGGSTSWSKKQGEATTDSLAGSVISLWARVAAVATP